ncbi:MAG: Xaa-Pro dipeptidase [Pseudomonadota bacterium]
MNAHLKNDSETYPAHLATLQQHLESSLEGLPYDGVAIYSGTPYVAFLDDYHFPFKANPHFLWWLPLTELPESWLLLRPGAKPRLLYHQPADYWHLPPEDPAGFWTGSFDIDVVSEADSAHRALPDNLDRWAAIGAQMPALGFADENPDLLVSRLHWCRAAKTEFELNRMRQASDLGVAAHSAAAQAFADGASEYEIHLAYLEACAHAEKELPYNNIIARNEHAAVLHYQNLDRDRNGPRHSFLIDAGASCEGYASDITRTYAEPGTDFEALVQAMEERQLKMVDSMRAGSDYAALHGEAHRHVAELLSEFEVVKGSAEETLESGLTGAFFPHGLGHLIGLQVHDVGGQQAEFSGGVKAPPEDYPFLRTTRTLEAGYVVTVEPGLYFIPALLGPLRANGKAEQINWARVDEFLPYGGIRIEDDVAVRAEGPPENLTRDAFARL